MRRTSIADARSSERAPNADSKTARLLDCSDANDAAGDITRAEFPLTKDAMSPPIRRRGGLPQPRPKHGQVATNRRSRQRRQRLVEAVREGSGLRAPRAILFHPTFALHQKTSM